LAAKEPDGEAEGAAAEAAAAAAATAETGAAAAAAAAVDAAIDVASTGGPGEAASLGSDRLDSDSWDSDILGSNWSARLGCLAMMSSGAEPLGPQEGDLAASTACGAFTAACDGD
jgi:hypothetical protein